MAKTHNKKRNVAIIFEQLLNKAAAATVEKKKSTADAAIGIIDKHFVPGSELYKEFRLFNALMKTTVPSEGIAIRILEESKKAARTHNASKLRSEKSALIKEINHTFKDKSFYNQKVKNYRDYATVQTLLNDWRSSDPDIKRIASYETHTVQMLLKEETGKTLNDEKNEDISPLTVNIMIEKFNKKYGMVLNDEQRSIIKEYVFSATTGNDKKILSELKRMKSQTLQELKMFKRSCDNNILLEKIDTVESRLTETNVDSVDDNTVSKFLLMSKLKQEILEKTK